jgi:hypothetical protein
MHGHKTNREQSPQLFRRLLPNHQIHIITYTNDHREDARQERERGEWPPSDGGLLSK